MMVLRLLTLQYKFTACQVARYTSLYDCMNILRGRLLSYSLVLKFHRSIKEYSLATLNPYQFSWIFSIFDNAFAIYYECFVT